MATCPKIKTLDKTIDQTGDHRILLRYIECTIPGNPSQKAMDFDSLVWERRVQGQWTEAARITKVDFQGSHCYRRWVAGLNHFDPATSHAVVKVGEEGEPDDTGWVGVTYSWREWNLETNEEVQVLKVCASPFEPFNPPEFV